MLLPFIRHLQCQWALQCNGIFRVEKDTKQTAGVGLNEEDVEEKAGGCVPEWQEEAFLNKIDTTHKEEESSRSRLSVMRSRVDGAASWRVNGATKEDGAVSVDKHTFGTKTRRERGNRQTETDIERDKDRQTDRQTEMISGTSKICLETPGFSPLARSRTGDICIPSFFEDLDPAGKKWCVCMWHA